MKKDNSVLRRNQERLGGWREIFIIIISFLCLVSVYLLIFLIFTTIFKSEFIFFLGFLLLIIIFIAIMWILSSLLKDSKKVMLKVAIVGGMFGFFLGLMSIGGGIAYFIWTFGKIFFHYPLSSYIMHYGCSFDRCLGIFWLRTIITSVVFSLIAALVYLIRFKKIKIHLQKKILLLFIVLLLIQMSVNVLAQKDLNDIVLQNINVSIDSPRAIRSGNEVVVRVIVKNLNNDTPIMLNSVDILNSKDEIIRTSNENKLIKSIKIEVTHLDELNNLRYSKGCTPETEREYYETAMKVRNNTFSKGFFLDIRDFDSNPQIGENITIPIKIKFSYNNENFIIDKFHTIPISEPLPAPPHNSPGWYKGDQHMHTVLAWDGEVPLSQMVSAAKTADLDWVIFTDHVQTLTSSEWTTGYNDCNDENIPTFKCMYSEELALDAGFCDPEHYLAYPYTDDNLGYIDTSCYLGICDCDDPQTKINEVNNAGGMGFIAHPYTGAINGWETWGVTGWTGLEIINYDWSGDDGTTINNPGGEDDSWREFLQDETNPDNGFVVGIGNSDAHVTADIGPPSAFTYCYLDSLSTTNIRNALKDGHCIASTGPFVEFTLDGNIIGSVVNAMSGTNTLDISANSEGFGDLEWLLIYVDEQLEDAIALSGTSYSDSVDINLDTNDDYIRLEVHTNTGRQAYTNPIWVDVTSCSCGSWTEGSCGGGSCSSSQKQHTRTCNPSGCAAETKCVYDEDCEEEEAPEVSECTESGYEFCFENEYGDCDVSAALNLYENVNNIQWGAVNDAWDPYVIGEYKIGWTGVDTEQMYYSVYDPDNDCYYGGCDGEEIDDEGTRVTVTAPGTAYQDILLGYDSTTNYWCTVWFWDSGDFEPNYGENNPVYVLNCFDDNDCSVSKYCDKSSSWSNWDCINDKSNGQSCTRDAQCSSGYCDDDGVGLSDDNHCFTPYNTYFDNQETSYCEYSTGSGSINCDERQVGEDLNLCLGLSYREEECSNTCSNTDITNIFECTDAGCSCSESLCDGLTTGSDITTCTSSQTYFADKCTSTAGGEDRGNNICRSSAFATGCTADVECNGVTAGTESCSETCTYTGTRFTIKTGSSDVAIFDEAGNLYLKGILTSGQGNMNNPAGNQFLIKDSSGNVIAYIDENGNVYIKGTLSQNQGSLTNPAGDDFLIKDDSGNVVAYITESGNLYLKGSLYENSIS